MNIMIVDDEKLFVQSLAMCLGFEEDIKVVTTASSANEAIRKNQENDIDIIILDIYMRNNRGIDIIEKLKKDKPKVKVVLLTSYSNVDNVINSIVCNADGIASKDIESEKLIAILRGVKQGLTLFDKSEISLLKDFISANSIYNKDVEESIIELTNIELIIVELITKGSNNKQISEELNYSIGTVKNYVSKIMKKIKVQDRTGIAVYALSNHLI